MSPGDMFKVKGERGKFKVVKVVEGLRNETILYAVSTKTGMYRYFYEGDERIVGVSE
jgi:hypothetical protein